MNCCLKNNINSLCLYIIFFAVVSVNAQEKPICVPETSVHSITCNNSADEKAFIQIIEQWKDGYNNGDAEKVAALYTDDAYYLTQHFITGIVAGRPAIKAYVQLGVDAKYYIDSIKIISMDCSEDFAYIITRYNSTNNGLKDFGLNIVVLKKIEEKWLIVAHESTVPDQDKAIKHLNILK